MLNPMMLAQMVINGFSMSAIYVLMALGFTLVFGIMRIVNFAHGELYMLGALGVYYLYGKLHLNYFAALGIAALGVAAFGVVLERLVYRPFYQKELQAMIATLGLSVATQHLGVILWGTEERSIQAPYSSVLQFSGLILPMDRLVVIVSAGVVMAAFYFLLQHTKIGLAMRVVAQDPEIAQAQGIRVKAIYLAALLTAVVLAALAGGLVGQVYSVSPFMGTLPMVKAFIVVILGGLGSIAGAVAGGFLLGMSESFLNTLFGAGVAEMAAFVVIILLLIWRPSGLLGRPEA